MTFFAPAIALGIALQGVGPSPSYDVLVHNDAELTAALAAHGAAGGKTIALDPAGVFASGRTFTQNPMARLRIISASSSAAAPLPSIILGNCSNLTFEGIDHSANTSTGACVTRSPGATPADIWWDKGCYFGGAAYDPNGDWSENAPTARSAFATNGDGLPRFKVKNCLFRYLNNAIKLDVWRGACEVVGNVIDVFYDDAVSLGWDWANPAHGTKINFNYVTRCAGLEADKNGTGTVGKGPHCDAFQVYEYNDPAAGDGLFDLEIIGNVVFDGDARGSIQMNLMRSTGTFVSRAKIAHNRHIVNKGDDFAPLHENVHSNYVFNNAAIYRDPGNPANMSTNGEIRNSPGMPQSLLAAQMSSAVVSSGAVQLGLGANVNVLLVNSLAGHQAQFEGPFPIPLNATREQVLAAIRLKTTATLGHLRDIVSYDAQTVDLTREPSWLGFENFTGQVVNAVCTTAWRKLQGGGAGQSIVPGAGVEYRLANSIDGSGATAWTAGAGTVNAGQYVQARKAASASGSTTVTATLTIAGWANSFDISTASTASFPEVDNGGTARSTRSGTPSSSAGNTWIIFAARFKHDAVGAANQAILTHGSAGSALHFQMMGGSNYRFRLKSSSDLTTSVAMAPNTSWRTVIVAVDLTKTNASEVFQMYADGSPVATSGSPTIPTSGVVTFNQNDFNDLAALGETDNGQLFDGKISFIYAHWGSGAIPFDITNAAHRDRFTADNIDSGGAGYGPTGSQAKVYLNGNAAAWDSGIANGGSLGGTFAKAAGAYT